MKSKRTVLILVITTMLALMVGAVSAQDDPPPPPQPGGEVIRDVIDIVAAETGLESEAILAKLRERPTLEDIILENGGDVEAVVAASVSAITERINAAVAAGDMPQERADKLLTNLEDLVRKGISGELRSGRQDQRQESLRERAQQAAIRHLLTAVSDATGLEQRAIIEQLRQDGATLAEVITANGGSVEAVIADAVASGTEQVNNLVAENKLNQEQADEIITSMETFYTDMVNGELPPRPNRPQAAAGRALVRMIADQTGLEVQDVVNQLKDGATVAEVLSANGVDVDTFIDSAMAEAQTRVDDAVAKGRMTQERANEMMEKLREQLTERINNPRPQPEAEA
jgi:hypothetical protein